MANPKHLQWLLEGSGSWNERRRQQHFKPDLTGANIYDAFNKAGKLNDKGHIPLSGINLVGADMSGAILSDHSRNHWADLRNAELWYANLKKAQLGKALLEGAILESAVLDEADLRDARLRNAILTCTDLVKTNLDGADLSYANFDGANLFGADLSSTILKSACLSGARLTNAVLHDTKLWEAKIFQKNSNNNEQLSESERLDNQNHRITCIEDLLEKCRTLNAQNTNRVLYFRGERTNDWELRSSVMRQPKSGEINFREHESVMLRNLQSKRPADFLHVSSTFAEWVLAQHHGLPTRLLDITRNPLVALFWACQEDEQEDSIKPGRLHLFSVPRNMVKPFNSDRISVLTNFAKLPQFYQEHLLGRTEIPVKIYYSTSQFYRDAMEYLYEKIQQEKPYFKDRLNPIDFFRVFVVEPQQSFERIRAQSGAFLISAYHERFEQKEIMNVNPETPIYDHIEFEVPLDSKHSIMDDLRLLNISRETLLPGLDEAARAVARGA